MLLAKIDFCLKMSVSAAVPAGGPPPPCRLSPSFAQAGAASVPTELSFPPAESWFVWLTDGVPALARMRLVKGFLFEACRGSPTPYRPLLTKFPSWSGKAVRKFLIDIVYC